jgi:hypothetical protein
MNARDRQTDRQTMGAHGTELLVQPGMCISTRNTSMTAWKMQSGMPRSTPSGFDTSTVIRKMFAPASSCTMKFSKANVVLVAGPLFGA